MKGIQIASTLAIAATQLLIQCNCHLRSAQQTLVEDKSRSSADPIDTLKLHAFREHSVGLAHPSIVKENRVSPSQTHEVMFAIEQRNVEELATILNDVSDPLSPGYGRHMTSDEVADLTANPASRDYVVAYLKSAGANIVMETLHGEFIRASAPVALWEKMFDTEFFTYAILPGQVKDTVSNSNRESETKRVIRTEKYSVPIALDDHVNAVFNTVQSPLTDLWKPLPPVPVPADSEGSRDIATTSVTGSIDPAKLISAYNIDNTLSHPRATQALFQTGGQSFSPADLLLFQTTMNQPLIAVNTTIGGHSVSSAFCASDLGMCAEGNLDMQYMMAISRSPTTNYYTEWNGFSNWLEQVALLRNPPLVLSISWGSYDSGTGEGEAFNFNVQAMKLGVMGVTIVVSSGDDGAVNDASRHDTSKCAYYPSFPATSPYVTAVGATQGIESGLSETVCQSDRGGTITSGGGFSTKFSQPSWQKSAVAGYFAAVNNTAASPYPGFMAGNRAIPDISATGANYRTVIGGDFYLLSGTSASAPVMGGMVSLVNAARLTAGLPSLGWINPVLYAYSNMFVNDVTSGNNKCNVYTCCAQGFEATAGWDPASGLGSLDFAKFKSFMMNVGDIATAAPTTATPTASPSTPTASPSMPTASPSFLPSSAPTFKPTFKPTLKPTFRPSKKPVFRPTRKPTGKPTGKPTLAPVAVLAA